MTLSGRGGLRAVVALLVLILTSVVGMHVSRDVAANAEAGRRAVALLESTYTLSALAREFSLVGSERLIKVWAGKVAALNAAATQLDGNLDASDFVEQLGQADRSFGELVALSSFPQGSAMPEENRLLLSGVALGQLSVVEQRLLGRVRAAMQSAQRRVDASVTQGAWLVAAVILLGSSLVLVLDLRFARRVAQELQRLREAALRIGGGDFKASAQALQIGEMKDLEASLRQMGSQLAALTDSQAAAIEQLRSEIAQRQQSDERLQLISRATLDGIWDWDAARQCMWWSESLHRLVGVPYSAHEHEAAELLRHVDPGDRERVAAELKGVFSGREAQWTSKFGLLRTDGRRVEIEARSILIRDVAGRIERMVGGFTDVTERHHIEAQLRQLARLQSLGQLTGGVAHDFNNLLTVILGNAEVLTEGLPVGGTQYRLATMVVQAAERAAELTHRLLAFARKQALAPKVVDVNALVGDMDGMLRRTLGEHIAIEWVRGAGLWPALVDPGQLENALLNLAINARDAMPGGGRLTIETANTHLDQPYVSQQQELTAGQYVMLAVSDSGVGILAADLDKVFEPFFTTKDRGKGTGLGLAMVHGFVKQSQGHVAIYSEVGRGTTVKLYLPRPGMREAPEAPPAEAVALKGNGELVLLVEDDELVRAYAAEQVRTLGYRVLEAGDGAQALAQMHQHGDVALLFTDVVMPGGMSGRELAEHVQALRPGLPVLYTSGYTENAIVHHGRLDVGVVLLGKPYRRSELARKLREALETSQASYRP